MHYYSDTMAKIGVSRLRMSDEDDVPATSVFVTIQPSDEDNDASTPDILVAIDESEDCYYPILCDITGQDSKVFLAKDPVAGAQTLLDPNLMYSITGGTVEACAALTISSNIG